jgi:dGTPase
MQSLQLAQRLDSILKPYSVKHSSSKGRAKAETPDQLRTPFQLDRDRVLHSKAFRRLKDKTQVFTPKTGDHFRNRLTHTLEVSQVSRSLARNLGVNEDLAEVIALAHDLGHTPFGHAGEHALHECAQKHGETFEHNAQSKRIVEEALNLTFETLEGLQKHQTPFDQANQKFVSATLEAQIVNLADEIAYLNHDLDDGLRSGEINMSQIQELKIWPEQGSISQLMKLMLQDLITQTEQNIANQNIQSLEDVYASQTKLVTFSSNMRKMVNELRKFLYQQFYMSDTVMEQTNEGQKIITALFEHYITNQDQLPTDYQQKITDGQKPVIVVMDYISGMTDTYATNKFQEYALS